MERKPGQPLGMRLISVDSLPGSYISEILPTGAAASVAAQFRPHDRIVSIDGTVVYDESHDAVVAILMRTGVQIVFVVEASLVDPMRSQPPPTMEAVAVAAPPVLLVSTQRTVVLDRSLGSLGLRLVTGSNATGLRVAGVIPDSTASRSGQIQIGDRIVAANGVSLLTASHDDGIAALALRQMTEFVLEADTSPLPNDVDGDGSSAPAAAGPPQPTGSFALLI